MNQAHRKPLSGAIILLSIVFSALGDAQTAATSNPPNPTPQPATSVPGPPKAEPAPPVSKSSAKTDSEKAQSPKPPVLSESGKAAAKLSEQWRAGTLHGQTPVTIDKVGRVQFPFGDSLPTVVCAPKGVCAIELEPGEKLRGDPHIGDSVRWHVELEYFGDATDGSETPVFIIKPDFGGLDTDLIVATNRRAYYIRLASDEKQYMPQVSFVYPLDEQKRMREIRDKNAAPPPPATGVSLASLFQPPPVPEDNAAQIQKAIRSMDFSFTVTANKKAERECLRPRAVYEVKSAGSTVIEMPSCVNVRNLPIVLVKEGSDYVKTNYRYTDGEFVIDQLIDSAVLRVGGNKGDIKNDVHIDRSAKEEARVR
jgi:type IV secretion system protein VirB9